MIEVRNKTKILAAVGISSFLVTNAFATENTVLNLLNSYNLGNDGFYNRVLSPAKTAEVLKSHAQRTNDVNVKIQQDITKILKIFFAADEKNKTAKVKAAAAQIDHELANRNTNIEFSNTKPSTATTRTIILIEKKKNIDSSAVLNAFTSYKRSGTPNTYIYEYSNPRSLLQSEIIASVGSVSSWKKPYAKPPMVENAEIILKKCRQLLGWKCVTSLYRTGTIQFAEQNIKYMFAGVYDLKNNSDHSEFSNDKRSYNQIEGSTALYVTAESANWIILVGVDAQWNEDKVMFTSLISEELQKDMHRIKERLADDLKISIENIK